MRAGTVRPESLEAPRAAGARGNGDAKAAAAAVPALGRALGKDGGSGGTRCGGDGVKAAAGAGLFAVSELRAIGAAPRPRPAAAAGGGGGGGSSEGVKARGGGRRGTASGRRQRRREEGAEAERAAAGGGGPGSRQQRRRGPRSRRRQQQPGC